MSRVISAPTFKLVEERLKNNELAQTFIEQKQARQLFVEVIKSFVGVKELQPNRGKEVQMFQSTLGLATGEPWCMAFQQTGIAYVEKKLKIKSPVLASGLCTKVWAETPTGQRVQVLPLAGAIAIWKHVSSKTAGHTGMVLDCDGLSFHAIEGNIAVGSISINEQVAEDGQGVRFTHRRYDLYNTNYGDMLLLGSLKPF